MDVATPGGSGMDRQEVRFVPHGRVDVAQTEMDVLEESQTRTPLPIVSLRARDIE